METLKARLGPFPVWIWLALITALGLTYYLYERRKNPPAAQPSGTDQVPETVNQESETETINITVPPEAPEPGPVPVPGPHGKCKPGYHFVAGLSVAEGARPRGAHGPFPYPVKGGMCVPDKHKPRIKNPGGPNHPDNDPGGPDEPTHHGQHRHKHPPHRHHRPPGPIHDGGGPPVRQPA